jgi:hypothetical protein
MGGSPGAASTGCEGKSGSVARNSGIRGQEHAAKHISSIDGEHGLVGSYQAKIDSAGPVAKRVE